MQRIPLLHRIGTKIVGVYLVALLPLVAVIAWLILLARQDAVEHGRDMLSRYVFEVSGSQESAVYEISRLLRGLVAAPEVRAMDAGAMDAVLTRLCGERFFVSNVFVCDLAGTVMASARKPFSGLNSAHRRYFREALAENGLVAGEYLVGRVTGNPVLHFALAIPGEDGRPCGVAVASLNLRSLRGLFGRFTLPDGACALALDVAGNVLAGYAAPGCPGLEKPQGDFPARVFAERKTSGSFLGLAPNGEETLYVYKVLRLDGERPEPYGLMLVSRPLQAMLAPARSRLVACAAIAAGSLCLVVLLLVVLGRVGIVRRLEVLAGFAGSLFEEKVCRLPPHFGQDEIGQLGLRFVELSKSLHDKSERLAETMGHLAKERDQLADVVGQLREAKDELERLASRDFLTGLRNRRCFSEKMQVELERFTRYGASFSLVLFDIDDFKRINDAYGHQVGDEVLRGLGRLTLAAVRSVDEAYRIGGEEFAVILPETDGQSAFILAERLRGRVEELSVPISDKASVRFTVSLGVAQARPGLADVKDLFAAADDALYKAKRTGKNRSELAADSAGTAAAPS